MHKSAAGPQEQHSASGSADALEGEGADSCSEHDAE